MYLDSEESQLREVSLEVAEVALPERAEAFVRDARQRAQAVKCFDFVPSSYELAWRVLSKLPRGAFCEWGSGLGVVTGLAEMVGFEASGIELDPVLAQTSRNLLRDHALEAQIVTGSYYELSRTVDIYYVYSWPSQIQQVERRFAELAEADSRLLICYGQEDLRCLMKQ